MELLRRSADRATLRLAAWLDGRASQAEPIDFGLHYRGHGDFHYTVLGAVMQQGDFTCTQCKRNNGGDVALAAFEAGARLPIPNFGVMRLSNTAINGVHYGYAPALTKATMVSSNGTVEITAGKLGGTGTGYHLTLQNP